MTPDDIPVLAGWMVTIPLWRRYGLTVESARAQFERALPTSHILLAADTAAARACGFAWCLPIPNIHLSPSGVVCSRGLLTNEG